ncbi:MAG: phospholipase D-like domain-containing protein, partial [Anaerolineales bacterium]
MAVTRRRSSPPFLALSALLLLAALFLFFEAQGLRAPSPERGTPAPPPQGVEIEAFFTRPEAGGASVQAGGIEAALAASIESAGKSVDLAVYHLALTSIEQALLRAHRRGVTVRVVTESENMLEPAVAALEAAGIAVLGDRREGLMHHKFIVIDRLQVWTGSMNLTRNDLARNDNNLIRVDSEQLAEDYRVEFDEMWGDRFGADSIADTPYPHLVVRGVPFEVYFAPDDGVAARVVRWIQGATSRIDFLAFSFTSDEIAQAMAERWAAGVAVRGVMDASQAE